MKTLLKWTLTSIVVAISVVGLRATVVANQAAAKPSAAEQKIAAALAKLAPADKTLAESQRWCAVLEGNRLGVMGAPKKVMVEGQEVFVCCQGCSEKASAGGKATIAKVAQFKKINAGLAKLSAEDRTLAESQRMCVVLDKSRLGSMGEPVKITVEGKTAFLCCEACRDKALANPAATAARLKNLTSPAKLVK